MFGSAKWLFASASAVLSMASRLAMSLPPMAGSTPQERSTRSPAGTMPVGRSTGVSPRAGSTGGRVTWHALDVTPSSPQPMTVADVLSAAPFADRGTLDGTVHLLAGIEKVLSNEADAAIALSATQWVDDVTLEVLTYLLADVMDARELLEERRGS